VNEISPFTSALAFIKKQVNRTSLFSAEELPVSNLRLLPLTEEEELLHYFITLPCLNKLVVSECGRIWEPWSEPLSTFLNKHSKYEILQKYDDRIKENRQKQLLIWIVSLCNWNTSQAHTFSSH